ncbi:transmembrane protein, putative (macronuclear) [Tetrahymena thermophila SB210]|uniref:Transmembrane protein, putative n=1 Tax=Tetrahymena thermophila (strain SB210) TaxID=312017 RepID=Q248C5_TETTS|nr:transmembrane protein, putative [Tetrahymena thermophila SB210]EAS04120.1 transmembrane protein, putative [Tetrahymena thermophila SB210]|eukprot:XP_001024365.1 transmembrane protein, putative [Tetrahymena thermophila SB210]
MKSSAKLFLVLLITVCLIRAVPMLRKYKKQQQHLTPEFQKNQQLQILLQDPYDHFAEELAQNPFAKRPFDNQKEKRTFEENKLPIFVPPGQEKAFETVDQTNQQNVIEGDTNDTENDVIGNQTYDEENGQTADSQNQQELNNILSGSDLTEQAVSDTTQGGNSQAQQGIGSGDNQDQNSAFGGDPNLSQQESQQSTIQHHENEIPTENTNTQQTEVVEEADTFLTGSDLVNDSINDKVLGESDFSGSSVGSGDFNFPNQAFKGDDSITQTDAAESQIQHEQNGIPVETDLSVSNNVQSSQNQQMLFAQSEGNPNFNGEQAHEKESFLNGGIAVQNIVTKLSDEEKQLQQDEIDLEKNAFD